MKSQTFLHTVQVIPPYTQNSYENVQYQCQMKAPVKGDILLKLILHLLVKPLLFEEV